MEKAALKPQRILRDDSLRKNWPGYLLILPAVLCVILLNIYPLLRGIHISFLSYNVTRSGNPDFQTFIGLKNYITVMKAPGFIQAASNTLIWTIGNITVHFAVAMMTALALNKGLKGRGILRVASLIPWAIPSAVAALTFFFLFDTNVGIVNLILVRLGIISEAVSWLGNPNTALPTVMIESFWKGTPFVLIFILAALQGIPPDVYESANIDGANRAQAFFRITLPTIKEPVAIAVVLDIIGTINNFNALWLMTQGGPLGSSEILYTYAYRNAFIRYNYGTAAAISVFIFILIAIFSILYIRLTTSREENAR